jgi:hypothetical protein
MHVIVFIYSQIRYGSKCRDTPNRKEQNKNDRYDRQKSGGWGCVSATADLIFYVTPKFLFEMGDLIWNGNSKSSHVSI